MYRSGVPRDIASINQDKLGKIDPSNKKSDM